MIIPLGVIAPPLGTQSDILVNFPELRGTGRRANSLFFQAMPSNLGNVYIGRITLNIADPNTVVVELPPPTVNNLPDTSMDIPGCPNAFPLDSIRVEIDNNGDGVRVSFTEW